MQFLVVEINTQKYRKAQKKWAWISQILGREVVDDRTSYILYKKVV